MRLSSGETKVGWVFTLTSFRSSFTKSISSLFWFSHTPWMMMFASIESFLWSSICSSIFSLLSSCFMSFKFNEPFTFAASAKLFFVLLLLELLEFYHSLYVTVSSILLDSFSLRRENWLWIISVTWFLSFRYSWHLACKSLITDFSTEVFSRRTTSYTLVFSLPFI